MTWWTTSFQIHLDGFKYFPIIGFFICKKAICGILYTQGQVFITKLTSINEIFTSHIID